MMANVSKSSAYEAYRSPEFRAFCEKFGIAWSLGTVNLILRFPLDGTLIVEQEYLPEAPATTPEESKRCWMDFLSQELASSTPIMGYMDEKASEAKQEPGDDDSWRERPSQL